MMTVAEADEAPTKDKAAAARGRPVAFLDSNLLIFIINSSENDTPIADVLAALADPAAVNYSGLTVEVPDPTDRSQRGARRYETAKADCQKCKALAGSGRTRVSASPHP